MGQLMSYLLFLKHKLCHTRGSARIMTIQASGQLTVIQHRKKQLFKKIKTLGISVLHRLLPQQTAQYAAHFTKMFKNLQFLQKGDLEKRLKHIFEQIFGITQDISSPHSSSCFSYTPKLRKLGIIYKHESAIIIDIIQKMQE